MSINIIDEMSSDFIVYANEVNNNRAFPDVRDGLKPSQRAVLWEMYSKGYSSSKPHVKCAKVDGGVIGNWSPHGSSYDTMVRMSQSWVNNLPEIDWHGANGSLQGGPEAAAARYTECRLSPVTEEYMLKGVKKDTVDYMLNFSEDLKWPTVLPSLLPRLFVNGSQGIGYTIAQEWEPGNLKEFAEQVCTYLKTGDVDCTKVYPDYPTGGVIVNKKDIRNIYETGHGNIILRAKYVIEENKILIYQLPYQVYVEQVISSIKDLVNTEKISGIEDIRNLSGDSGITIEITCTEDPKRVIYNLFKLTDLQVSFTANQMALVKGKPELLTLKDYIKIYIDYNIECLVREYTFDKNKDELRLEIVSGLLKAIRDIDNIVRIIKESASSEDSISKLVNLGYTTNQANAVVDMKLAKLSGLESSSLEKEQNELVKNIETYNRVLNSKENQEKEFLKRLSSLEKEYGWGRRTTVIDLDIQEEKESNKPTKSNNHSNEQVFIQLLSNNNLKKLKLSDYGRKSNKSVKTIKTNADDKVCVITNLGNQYKIPVKKIKFGSAKSSGENIDNILKPGETVVDIYSGSDHGNLVLFTKNGKYKKLKADEIFGVKRNECTIIKLIKAHNGNLIVPFDKTYMKSNSFRIKQADVDFDK